MNAMNLTNPMNTVARAFLVSATIAAATTGAQFDPLIVSAVGPLVGASGFQDSWVSLASHMESMPIAA